MKKGFIFLFLITLFLFSCNKGEKENGDNNANYSDEYTLSYLLNEGGEDYTVTGISNDKVSRIEIPEKYNGKPVTKIERFTFKDCWNLIDVELPNTLKCIEYGTFQNCSKLKSITLPESLEEFNSVFYDCNIIEVYNLSKVNIILSQDWGKNELNGQAFVIHKSKSEESILKKDDNGYIFAKKDDKNYLVGYEGNKRILNLPERFKDITEYTISYKAFYNNRDIISVTIPESVKEIEEDAFKYCYNLKEIYNLSNINIRTGNYIENGYVGCYAKVVHKNKNEKTNLILDGDFLFTHLDNETYFSGYLGDDKIVELPTDISYDGEKIKEYIIDNYSFVGKKIVKLIFPEGVTELKSAFWESIVYSITFPTTFKKLDGYPNLPGIYEIYNLSSIEKTRFTNYDIGYHTSIDEKSILTITDEGFVIYEDTVFDYFGKSDKLYIKAEMTGKKTSDLEFNRQMFERKNIKELYIDDFEFPQSLLSILNNKLHFVEKIYFNASLDAWNNDFKTYTPANLFRHANEFYVKKDNDYSLVKEINISDFTSDFKASFKGYNKLEKIILPKTSKAFHLYLFLDCENFKSVEFEGTKDEFYNSLYYFYTQDRVKEEILKYFPYGLTISCSDGKLEFYK